MTASLAYLPDMPARRDRIKAIAAAQERASVIRKAKRIIDNPSGYTDAQLREVCGAFMAMSPTPAERAADWGVYYLRADQHIYAINARERLARNRAARIAVADDTSVKVAMRYADRWPEALLYAAGWALVMLLLSGWA